MPDRKLWTTSQLDANVVNNSFRFRRDCIQVMEINPDRLLITEELYGRESETATLRAAFDRVVAQRAPELALVSGYSGIGKSAVVNELHKVLVPPRGLFAAGKFDQYKRDIPYATLAQAFQNPDPPDSRQERSGNGRVAARLGRGARRARTTDDRPRPNDGL
jgi:hypothetical protein